MPLLFHRSSPATQELRSPFTRPWSMHQHIPPICTFGICILWHPMAVIFGASPSFLQDLWGKPGWPGCCQCWKLDLAGPGCLHLLVHFLNRLRIRPRHPIGCEGCTSAQNYRSKANLWPIGACPWCDLQEISNWPKKYLSNLSIFT